ncbi:MAG TPA: hypothetical protein VIJ01_02640 [Candidatus Angelobacter sp.]
MWNAPDRIDKLLCAIWITVTGWIVSLQARRRMKKSLGRKATDLELASLNTWMRVDEAATG